MMLQRAAVAATVRPLLQRRTLSSFADLELSMWQKGATAYAKSFGAITAQAADALLDGVRVWEPKPRPL